MCLPDGFALLGDVGVPHAGDAPVIVLAALLIVSFALLIAPAHHVLHDPGGIIQIELVDFEWGFPLAIICKRPKKRYDSMNLSFFGSLILRFSDP